MRKPTTIFLVGLATLVFTACGGSSSSSDGGSTPPPSNTEPPTESNVYIDEELGVMWQDDVYTEMTTKTWISEENYDACRNDDASGACEDTSGDTAATYCSDMTLNDYADWRLPTKDELTYLYESDKYLNLNYIAEHQISDLHGYDKYWTSTSSISWKIGAYAGFDYGTSEQAKDAFYYVRCIRAL